MSNRSVEPVPHAVPVPNHQQGSSGRTAASILLIVISLILFLTGVVAGFLRYQVNDEASFVGALQPLASSPAVQQEVADRSADAVTQAVVPSLVQHADSILGSGTASEIAVRVLESRLTDTVHGVVHTQALGVVSSPAFSGIWREMLVAGHSQLVGSLSGSSSLVVVSDDDVRLELGPMVEAVRAHLSASGWTWASLIPSTAAYLTVVHVPGLTRMAGMYQAALALAPWLPLAAAVMWGAGVAVAPARRRAAVASGSSLSILMALALVGVWLGHPLIGRRLSGVSADAARQVYDAMLSGTVTTICALGLVGLLVAATAWLLGPGWIPVTARRGWGTLVLRVADRLPGGRLRFLASHRAAIRVALGSVAILACVLVVPLTVWVVLIALAAWLALRFLLDAAVVASRRQQPTTTD